MIVEKEREAALTSEVKAEDLYENPILYALKNYLRTNGSPSKDLLDKLTCVPDFIKATMLGNDDVQSLLYYADHSLGSINLPYEVIAAYTAENDFETKEEWRIRLGEELEIIAQEKLFPSGIYECFAEAYIIVRDELSLKALKGIRKNSLSAKENRLGNLFFRDLTAHLATVTVDPAVVETFTCVPLFMKMALLGEGDLGKSYYENATYEIGYPTMCYEIMEEFMRNHDFPSKVEWDEAFCAEIREIENSGYFPYSIVSCFRKGLYEFVNDISIENIREVQRILMEEADKYEE